MGYPSQLPASTPILSRDEKIPNETAVDKLNTLTGAINSQARINFLRSKLKYDYIL